MSEAENAKARHPQAFLSYAQEDRDVAIKIADTLRNAGLRMWFNTWELASGDSIAERIDHAAAGDFLVVLLSRHSVASQWVQQELNAALTTELKDRAITLIPVMIEDCELPQTLSDRFYLDLRYDLEGGAQELTDQLLAAPDIDFSHLDGPTFEELVASLLVELGFSVRRPPRHHDSEFDIIASYPSHDPFRTEKTETWLVATKFYEEERINLLSVSGMILSLFMATAHKKGLFVTNSRLTSVARRVLAEFLEKSRADLRVIDRTELTSLLLRHPNLARRYFTQGTSHE